MQYTPTAAARTRMRDWFFQGMRQPVQERTRRPSTLPRGGR